LIEIGGAIQRCSGVDACNITVSEIDMETVGTNITIEGTTLDYEEIVRAIENTGAVVHSLDQVIVGDRLLENIPRKRKAEDPARRDRRNGGWDSECTHLGRRPSFEGWREQQHRSCLAGGRRRRADHTVRFLRRSLR
jgi:uncharacterized protein